MSPRPAKLQGASSQPKEGFIGFVKFASGGQGPPGTRQHHRGKKEKQTMKLKGISFPEPRLTHAIQEHVSPWFLPSPSDAVLGLCLWCSQAARVTVHMVTQAAVLGHPIQKSRTWKGFWGRKDTQRCLRGQSTDCRWHDLNLITSAAEGQAQPLLVSSGLGTQ